MKMIRPLVVSFVFLMLAVGGAAAQSVCQYIVSGAVLTAGQWAGCFSSKLDYTGPVLLLSGGTMTGELITAPSTAQIAGFSLPPGVAPTTPANGNLWTTSAGLFVQINGVTVGPLAPATSAGFAATLPLTVTFPSGIVTYALNYNTSLALDGSNNLGVNYNASFALDGSNKLGINLANSNIFTIAQSINLNAAALPAGDTGTVFQVGNANATISRVEVTSAAAAATVTGRRADGTFASPTALSPGDLIATFNAHGYDGTSWSPFVAGALRIYADGPWSATSHPTEACLSTTPLSSTTIADRLCVHQDGGATIGTATGGNEGLGTINLAGALYDNGTAPTGTNGYVRATSPTFVTSIISPIVYGGAAAGSNLKLASTSNGTPSADFINFFAGNAEVARFINGGSLLVGGTISQTMGSQPELFQVYANSAKSGFQALRYSSPGSGGSLLQLGSSNGAAPGTFSASLNGNGLGVINFVGDNSAAYTIGANIIAQAIGTWTTSSYPTQMTFSAVAAGSTTLTPVETIAAGAISVLSANFGLSGNISSPAWTTNGVRYKNVAVTLTDTTSAGTVAAAYSDLWGGSTIAASSIVTFTEYDGSYFKAPVAGTNVTFGSSYALAADSLHVIGTIVGATINATTGFQVNGTALAASNLSNGVTGAGAIVLATSPTFLTALTSPIVYGGNAAGSSLQITSTSNVAPSGDFINIVQGGIEQERFTGGKILRGATSPQTMGTTGSINPSVQNYDASAAASYGLVRQTTPGAGGAIFVGGSSRSTPSTGSYSALLSGDGLFSFVAVGDTGSSLNATGAAIAAVADGNWSGTSSPGRLTFNTTQNGATNYTLAETIDSKQHIGYSGAIPVLSACGTTPSLRSGSTDVSGEITTGTGTPTSCTLTFANAFAAAPFCVVTWQANLASMGYSISAAALTITQTATSSTKIDYHCFGN